ncbi:hypothetical protein KQX54_011043 [Cotesia glomerata]|uniref:Uncharacterized protein n=1 Tax=Cotesia glomerata TaxID=32391 RepID=A0AAV7I791_COTGL|nr:hypothetical protein KQX54_011043 [Cotesia glomerata]
MSTYKPSKGGKNRVLYCGEQGDNGKEDQKQEPVLRFDSGWRICRSGFTYSYHEASESVGLLVLGYSKAQEHSDQLGCIGSSTELLH